MKSSIWKFYCRHHDFVNYHRMSESQWICLVCCVHEVTTLTFFPSSWLITDVTYNWFFNMSNTIVATKCAETAHLSKARYIVLSPLFAILFFFFSQLYCLFIFKLYSFFIKNFDKKIKKIKYNSVIKKHVKNTVLGRANISGLVDKKENTFFLWVALPIWLLPISLLSDKINKQSFK